MAAEMEPDLTELQFRWGAAYDIGFDEVTGTW